MRIIISELFINAFELARAGEREGRRRARVRRLKSFVCRIDWMNERRSQFGRSRLSEMICPKFILSSGQLLRERMHDVTVK